MRVVSIFSPQLLVGSEQAYFLKCQTFPLIFCPIGKCYEWLGDLLYSVCFQPNNHVHASHFSSHVLCIIQPILCRLLTTDILLLGDWKLKIGHLMWQSSKVWFMFQRSNWQHFLRLQAALVRFLTYLKTLGDIYLALNSAGWSQIIYLCLELPLNKEQACFCG